MNILIQISIVLISMSVIAAYWVDSEMYPGDGYPVADDYTGLSAASTVKRKFSVCMKWGMICVPKSRLKFTKCCPGLSCMCSLWKSGCKCRAKLG